MVIALIVTSEGFPFSFEAFDGIPQPSWPIT